MPTYDDYRNLLINLSSEQKLATLRPEAKRLLSKVNGFALLVLKLVEERGAPQMPPGFLDWCKELADGAEELRDLIDAVTDSEHRNVLLEQRKEAERIRAEGFWREEQTELPELQKYSSFVDAIKHTLSSLNLSLPKEIGVTNPFYPSVMTAFSTTERRVNVHAVLAKRGMLPFGYAVSLSELASDGLNVKGSPHEGCTKSLNEVATVLHRWLTEKWDLEKIKNEHEWMKTGTILWHRLDDSLLNDSEEL